MKFKRIKLNSGCYIWENDTWIITRHGGFIMLKHYCAEHKDGTNEHWAFLLRDTIKHCEMIDRGDEIPASCYRRLEE